MNWHHKREVLSHLAQITEAALLANEEGDTRDAQLYQILWHAKNIEHHVRLDDAENAGDSDVVRGVHHDEKPSDSDQTRGARDGEHSDIRAMIATSQGRVVE